MVHILQILWSPFSLFTVLEIYNIIFSFDLGGKDGLVGFDEFMYNDIVPACLHAPMKPTFDLADAQTVLVCKVINIIKLYHIITILIKITFFPNT